MSDFIYLKKIINGLLHKFGCHIRLIPYIKNPIPDREFYSPFFSPWLGYGEFRDFHKEAVGNTLVSSESCYILYALALQALQLEGEIWECGVYQGGTARLLAAIIERKTGGKKTLRLFDTFCGMPETDPQKDLHRQGDFANCREEDAREYFADKCFASLHVGLIPDTFKGLEDARLALAHIDVDIYSSVMACCRFIYQRLLAGGMLVFDDYGLATCPGARKAVDEFFADMPENPIVLATGQALVIKLPEKN